MSSPLEAMYQEALSAFQSGERARARDLLTRLIKAEPDHSDYWIWMSAVVDTAKERAYCLKEALRLDPQNTAAARGLMLMGIVPPDPAEVVPARLQKRNWRSRYADDSEAAARGLHKNQIAIMGAAFVVLVGLVGFGIWGATAQQANRVHHNLVINLPTDTALAVSTTPTPAARATSLSGTPDPLWMQLKETYTPAPMYVNTPHSVAEAYAIGMRAFQRGAWADAVTYFKQAADVTSNAPDVLYYLGESYRMQGNQKAAIDTYTRAIKQSPDFAPSYYGRALAVLADTPKEVDAVSQDLETALQKDPGFAEAYLGVAQLDIQSGKPKDALDVLKKASSAMPDSASVFLYRAKAYLALGDAKQALANAEQARQKDVTLLEAYHLQGLALQAGDDYKASIEPLKTYVLYQADDAEAWAALAKAYLEDDQLKDAQQAADKALKLDDHMVEAYVLRGQILLDQKNAEDALDDFKAGQRLDSKSYAANLGVGQALMALNYPGDAYQQFEKTRPLAEEDLQKAEVLFWRAQSLDQLGEAKAALRDYQDLVDMPEDSVKPEWVKTAQERIDVLATPTPTQKARTATPTRTPTRTPMPTQTRWPTATSRP